MIAFDKILIPISSVQYEQIVGIGIVRRSWRVWYIFGIRVLEYDTTAN